MQTRTVLIVNKLGLHARAAAKFVATAKQFQSRISACLKDESAEIVDGKNIMAMMLLAASKGTQLQLQAEGSDECAALDALCALIAARFDEPE